MRTLVTAVLFSVLGLSVASAQDSPRLYAGGALSASRVTADEVKGATPTGGVIVGVRLTPSFSVEADVSRGFHKIQRSYEGTSQSFAPPGSSYDDIVRQAVHRRWDIEWTPTLNLAALAVWRSTSPSRVGAAVYGGVTLARYREETRTVVTALPAVVPVPPDSPSLLPTEQIGTRNRGGLTGGLMIPIRIAGSLSVAPELRVVYGSIGDEKHNLVRGGLRVLWGF
jgi:hypothetical protein